MDPPRYETPYEERPRGTRDERPYDEELYRRGARSRRSAGDDVPPAPRVRRDERPYDEGRYDEPRYESRRALETGRRRAEYEAEQAAVPRSRRYAEDQPPRGRRYAAEEESPRGRRYAAEEEPPRSRRYAAAEEEPPRSRRYAEDQPPRGRRYAEEEPRARRSAAAEPPRGRHSGEPRYEPAPPRARHSRTEFVDLSDPNDPNYMPPDETPTLVDIAARRARRAAEQRDGVRSGGRNARRARTRGDDDVADVQYWRQLRGEAQ
jgi:hypothetical protein